MTGPTQAEAPPGIDRLRVDLDEIAESPTPFSAEIPAAWVKEILAETDAITEQGGKVELELNLQPDRTLLVRGSLDLRYQVPCARCLEPATVDVGAETGELCVTYVPADRLRSWAQIAGQDPDQDEPDGDIEPLEPDELDEIGYEGTTVDLSGLIAEQILLAYPMRALCSFGEACLGLCMRCGAELNPREGDEPRAEPLERCPACGQRLDGEDEDPADSPWKAALAKVGPSKS